MNKQAVFITSLWLSSWIITLSFKELWGGWDGLVINWQWSFGLCTTDQKVVSLNPGTAKLSLHVTLIDSSKTGRNVLKPCSVQNICSRNWCMLYGTSQGTGAFLLQTDMGHLRLQM